MAEQIPRPADLETLGLSFDEDLHHARFDLTARVARHDGGLYGGTAIAASVVAMEAVTNRGALWVTTQYVATAKLGDSIELASEVLATGRKVTQVLVRGTQDQRLLFVSVGSTATPREGGLEGQYLVMPNVTPPEDNDPMILGFGRSDGFRGFTEQVEYRQARLGEKEESAPPLVMWSRLRGGRSVTPAAIAFMADMVPGAIARAAGLIGGGASLDNSLRFGRIPRDEEWILLELRGQMAIGSHAHGSVKVWTRDGALVAVGGQSANMMNMVDPKEFEGWESLGMAPPL
ncbi:MAG TPA: thioesterase family protein [Acidimicrobiales bacterium]|nr:thioesterase family protein [Acidimicrobiales bacterium]